MGMAGFVHLRTRSSYSLLDGMLSPGAMVDWAAKQQMPAIALADHHNLFGVMEFALAGNKAGVQPLLAAAIELEDDDHSPYFPDARSRTLVLIVQNAQGYENLNKLITSLYLPILDGELKTPAAIGSQAKISLTQLCNRAEGLILLCGGMGAPLGQMLLQQQHQAAKDWLATVEAAFPERLFLEMQRHNLPDEDQWLKAVVQLADSRGLPLVATNDCRFLDAQKFSYHDALRAVATAEKVSQTEPRQKLNDSYFLRPATDMQDRFADVPDALANTLVVAQMCRFTLYDLSTRPKMPTVKTLAKDMTADTFLADKTATGLKMRLAQKNIDWNSKAAETYKKRMDYELMVIGQSGFAGYFLIVEDFIAYARNNDIPVGPGRGSGVGSVVAWSLQITALDPLEWNLLFERFLNLERISVPDFDIDFCTEKRDQVIDYVEHTYGSDSVAQIITFGKLRSRGVLRDVGRVLDIPYGTVDRLCKLLPKEDVTNPQTLAEIHAEEQSIQREIREDETIAQLWEYAVELEGCYRHASTHAAGVVIADRSLIGEVALYYDPKNDLKATQLNMKSAEKAGLVKFDFLGLSTMTIMTAAAGDAQRLYGQHIDFDLIDLNDPAVFKLICDGQTDGIFQLESPGMRRVAVQLKPDCFADIIAMVALFRPGPMENIPQFIACKHGHEEITFPHPLLEDILKETYGIAIYQEQIMQMTQTLAGFTLGKSDQVRRAMGKKDAKVLETFRQEFIEEAGRLHGINPKAGDSIFETIMAFAAYGFNKSHSAAYALVAYWTGWLKVHYGDCLLCAILNNAIHSPNTLAQYVIETKRMGITLLAVDINTSEAHFHLNEKKQMRYGLGAVRGVGISIMQEVIAERQANGPYPDLGAFMQRTRDIGINRKLLEALITAGAFDSILPNRQPGYVMVNDLIDYARHCREIPQDGPMLFVPELPPPPDIADIGEWSSIEKLQYEFSALGFHFSQHPVDVYHKQLVDFGVTRYHHFSDYGDERRGIRIAGHVYDQIMTRTRPTKRKGKEIPAQPLLILKMSDTDQMFSVHIEGQEAIDETLAILVDEKLLLIDAHIRWAQIGWHISGFRVRNLPKAVPDSPDECFTIRLNDTSQKAAVVELLQQVETTQDTKKGAEIHLIVNMAQGLGKIKLPDRYHMTLELRRALAALPDVDIHVTFHNAYYQAMMESSIY